MIAGFIVLRLRNILGRKTGHEDKVFSDFNEKKFEKFKEGIKQKQDSKTTEFDPSQRKQFLKGAEIAYENIITAFSKGDKKSLNTLLTKNMSNNFTSAIEERNAKKIKSELTFVGFKQSKLEKFEKIKNEFYATVKFVCEIISVKRDKENKIVEGNPDKIKTVTDHWKFSRNVFSKKPNWYLAEIVSNK